MSPIAVTVRDAARRVARAHVEAKPPAPPPRPPVASPARAPAPAAPPAARRDADAVRGLSLRARADAGVDVLAFRLNARLDAASRTPASAAVAGPTAATPPASASAATPTPAPPPASASPATPPPAPADPRADANARVAQAAHDDPASVPRVFEEESQKLDPAQVEGFVQDVRPELESAARRAAESSDPQTSQEVMRAFGRVAERGGDGAAQALGQIAAAPYGYAGAERASTALHDGVRAGEGLRFASAFRAELERTGKTDAAVEVTRALTGAIEKNRTEFEAAHARVDELKTELAHLTASYGGVLTPEQQTTAIRGWQARHQADFDRFEAEARRYQANLPGLTAMLDPQSPSALADPPAREGPPSATSESNDDRLARARYDLKREAAGTAEKLPELADSEVGREVLADLVEASGRKERTLLDVVGGSTKLMKDGAGFSQKVAAATLSAASVRAAGHPESASAILDGLEHNASLLGVSPEKLHDLRGAIDAVSGAHTIADFDAAQAELEAKLKGVAPLSASTPVGQAFRGFAAALGTASLARNIQDWGTLDPKDKVATVLSGLDVANNGLQVVLDSTSALAKVLPRLSNGLGLAGVVIDGVTAYQAFGDGKTLQGIGSSASAVGGLLLSAAAASQTVPVAGQAVGAVLVGLGVGINQYAKSDDANRYEAPSREFLETALGGLRDPSGQPLSPERVHDLADKLANHTGDGKAPGILLRQVADQVGVSPQALLQHLATLPPDRLDHLIEGAVHAVETDADGTAKDETGRDDVGAIRDWSPPSLPGSVINGLIPSVPNPFNRWQPITPAGSPERPQPTTLNGLAAWMEAEGFLPPGARAA